MERAKNLIQVDGGNLFFAARPMREIEKDKNRALVLARAMSYMKVDVINVGTQDLNAGLEFLLEQLARLEGGGELPLISANLLRENGERPLPSFKIVPVEGVNIAFLGLLTGRLPMTDPAFKIEDPIERARELVPRLRQKCELVVVLFAADQAEAYELARLVPGIDLVVVSGRRHMRRDQPLAVGDSMLLQAGGRGMYLGRLELALRPEAAPQLSAAERDELRSEIELLEAQQTILSGQIQREPEVRGLYQSNQAELELLRRRLADANARLAANNLLIGVRPEFPEDETVAEWIKAVEGQPRR